MPLQERSDRTLTAIEGIQVGHATVPGGGSGCTAVLGPFRGAVQVTGMATGTRELDTLSPEHLVPRIDAVVLSGGSAFGLAAAHGVMAWLSEQGRGFPTGAGPVPIVPAAILYDLAADRARPDSGTGYAAASAASTAPVPEGRVGAGAGATVGKVPWRGPDVGGGRPTSMPGGLGSWAVEVAGYRVAALAAVNAVGDVLDRDGRIVAGLRAPDGTLLDSSRAIRDYPPVDSDALNPRENTTLCVVATDAPASQEELRRIARMAATAMPRRIRPTHTPWDGDLVFALSATEPETLLPEGLSLSLGDAAREALEEAITRAVLSDEERARRG